MNTNHTLKFVPPDNAPPPSDPAGCHAQSDVAYIPVDDEHMDEVLAALEVEEFLGFTEGFDGTRYAKFKRGEA